MHNFSTTAMLLRQLKEGNKSSSKELFALYQPAFLKWTHSRIPTQAKELMDSQDMVQNTLLLVFNSIDTIRTKIAISFFSYIRSIFINQSKQEIRQNKIFQLPIAQYPNATWTVTAQNLPNLPQQPNCTLSNTTGVLPADILQVNCNNTQWKWDGKKMAETEKPPTKIRGETMKKYEKKLMALTMLLVFANSFADYTIKKYSINNGGMHLSGGNYEMNASIAQVDASNTQSNGNYILTAGFWQQRKANLIFANGFE